MVPLSRWAVRRPVLALLSWVVFLLSIAALGARAGGDFNDSFELPDTESAAAQQLLEGVRGAEAATTTSARIVWSAPGSTVTDPTAVQTATALLADLAGVTAVACVTNPFDPQGNLGSNCAPAAAPIDVTTLPADQQAALQQAFAAAAKATSPISADGTVAYATVTFEGEVTPAISTELLDIVRAANTDQFRVGASGLFTLPEVSYASEAVGLGVAILTLLIAFGSVVAAGLPILTAIVGLGAGLALVSVTANFFDVATFAPTLGTMIGLGVGIDYALFVLNRYRQAVNAGHEPKSAAIEAVNTAGRSVQFAAVTVVIAISGLYVLGLNFFTGLAIAATATVLMVMLSALWLLPAVISLLGRRVLALHVPGTRRAAGREGARLAHYGTLIQRRPWLPLVASLLVLGAVAAPAASLRLGFSDDSGALPGSPARISYDLLAEGFGPGSNGPFFVAVELSNPGDAQSFAAAITAFAQTEGVAATVPTLEMLPLVIEPTTTVSAIQVIPETAPQDLATTELLDRLRTQTIPDLEAQAPLQAYVGGFQAVAQDFTSVLTDALPLFLLVVVGLGFVALLILFRSVIVALTATVTSLISLAAAIGITVAVFQWGWLQDFFNVTSTGPILPFLPIMVFAILFGLAMDYHVFLASRMQEEWMRTRDNAVAIRRGLAGSGRVVMIAATIMTSVFLAFVPSDDATIKLFGLTLGTAVLIDAFIVRLLLVPSIMSLLGSANWWLPGWLDRLLPTVTLEHGEDEIADDPDIEQTLVTAAK